MQDLVMTRLMDALFIEQMEEKELWLKQHWETLKLKCREDGEDLDPEIDTYLIFGEFWNGILHELGYQPSCPSIAMLHAAFVYAPPNSLMRKFISDLMAYIIFEGDVDREVDWQTSNVVEFSV